MDAPLNPSSLPRAGLHVRASRSSRLLHVLLLSMAALACYQMYVRGLPWGIGRLSLLHGSTGVLLGAVGAFLALAAPAPNRACLLVGWLCLWFTAGLAELRSSAVTDGIVLGGVIPYSDACNYLQESSLVIEGHRMTA